MRPLAYLQPGLLTAAFQSLIMCTPISEGGCGKKGRDSATQTKDGLQGCPEGFFYRETFEDFGLGCMKCPPGRYADERSVSLECKACAAGRFSDQIGSTSCRQCAAGTVAQQTGLSECIECPMGRAPLDTSWCDSCPPATYQSGPTCMPCPTGFTSTEESTSIRACTRKGSILLLNLLLVFFLVGLALLLPLLLGRPLPIDDIYMEDGYVVVKTWGGHRIARWSPVPLHIQLKHTQHPEAPFCFKGSCGFTRCACHSL